MKYKIIGGSFPAVVFSLNSGESIQSQSGGMSWMTEDMAMETHMKGGLGGAFKRSLSGESAFMNDYTAKSDDQEIAFAATLPGTIVKLDIEPGKEYVATKGAFLCATPGVDVEMHTVKKLSGALFGGGGFFLVRLTGKGTAFIELGGHVEEYDLAPGQVMKVDTGNVAYFEGTVSYQAETVKGAKNIIFGGEGLFLTKVTGPGKVYLQTMTASELAGAIQPYIVTGA